MFEMDRRTLLKTLGSVAAESAFSKFSVAAAPPARASASTGCFRSPRLPFTPDNKLDLDCLGNEVKFCNRGGVPGLIWPQIASGWSTLTTDERFAGAEAMIAAGKGGKTAIVIGVQTQGKDLAGAIAYAKHAAKTWRGCDLLAAAGWATTPRCWSITRRSARRPTCRCLCRRSGDMPVDLVVQMFKAIPTVQVVKDEAGDPLKRVTELRAKTDGKLAVFAGKGVRQMMDEMRLGFTGFCPTVGMADVFQQAWELYEAGKVRESFDMFGRIQAFSTITDADRYVMVARGIFKEDTKSRPTPGMGSGGGAAADGVRTILTEADKKNVRDALNTYLKPYLRG